MAETQTQDEQVLKARFMKGTRVEVNIRDRQTHEAWFSTSIVKEINHDMFMVGYSDLRPGKEKSGSKAIVEALHVRPSPPEHSGWKDFGVSEKVDVYYDCGWWVGEVCKVFPDKRYIINYEHKKEQSEFKQSELRCHMDWVNGKWVQHTRDRATKHHQDDIEKTDQAQLSEHNNTATSIDTASELLPRKRSINQCSRITEIASPHLSKKLKKDEATEGSSSVLGQHDPSLPPLSNTEGEQCMPVDTQIQTSQKDLIVESLSDSIYTLGGDGIKQHKEETQTQITVLGTREQPEKMVLNDFEGVLPDNPLDRESSLQNNEVQKPFVDNSNTASLEHESSPFVKRSPLWETLESMEVFKSFYQRPHFQPLQQTNELLCEGLAFGYMMSFANVVDKTRNAHIDEPNGTLENDLNAVFDLKVVGFDVQRVQTRLEDLLRIKDKQVEIDGELKQVEEKIKEEEWLTSEVNEVNERIIALQESISKLREKRIDVLKKKTRKRFRVSEIEKKIQETENQIDRVTLDFDRVVAAPW